MGERTLTRLGRLTLIAMAGLLLYAIGTGLWIWLQ